MRRPSHFRTIGKDSTPDRVTGNGGFLGGQYMRFVLGAMVSLMGWTSTVQGQLSEALMKDKSIKVRQLSADQALMELQIEYRDLLSSKGKDHEDTREVAAQLAELKRRLAAIGRPVSEAGGTPSSTSVGTRSLSGPTGDQLGTMDAPTRSRNALGLTDQQLEIMVDRYQKMKAERGPSDPTVQRLKMLLEASLEDPSTVTTTSPPLIPSAAEAEVLKGQQDPWELLLGLVRRVETLEQEVLQLRREVRQLRAANGKVRDSSEPIAIP